MFCGKTLYNPNFNPIEFEGFRNQAGLNVPFSIFTHISEKIHSNINFPLKFVVTFMEF